eukprot:g15706.t1
MGILLASKSPRPLSILFAAPLIVLPAQKSWVITIHKYNSHIPAADVLTFLGRYVQLEGGSTDLVDLFGMWTSKRLIKETLKVDASGKIVHPSSSFAIGGSRGCLTYMGQPRVCRTCGRAAHVAADCKVTLSRNCKQEGHLNKSCKESRSCNQ